ncbi:MAG: ABC transporter permease [Cyclobacteriaceae bacterium]|nr:ABC transporter permease [Cyclobacteriaceae bacterium]
MFDLEKEIKGWLRQFRKHRAFNHGSVREMELHLRDHIDDLLAQGHNENEAFEKAVKEFGEINMLAKEEFLNLRPKHNWASFLYHGLLGNYMKIAVRNFIKQPFFTFLNTFGLALGLAGGLLIALFIYDELSYDKMFGDADRIYRVNIDNRTSGEESSYATAPGPMGGVLKADCPQVELVTRFREVDGALVRRPGVGLNVKETHVAAVDSSFFAMFGLKLLEGNPRTALKEPYSIVLTRSAAQRHFGPANALGKSLLLDNEKNFVVTGVMEDLPRNSFLRNHNVFISLSSYPDANTLAWNTWYFPTFVKLAPDSRVGDLQSFLNTVKENYLIPWAMTFVPGLTIESSRAKDKETGNYMRFNTTALTDIHLHSTGKEGEFSPNSDIENVYIMAFIGLFLIILASVNFMNLSTAHSLTRAKEVGIRKTLGSNKLGLVKQFLTESVIISFLSLILSMGIVVLALPLFNGLAGKNISIPFESTLFWTGLVATTVLLGLLSGGYPAFFMSRFVPAKVLKGGHGGTRGGGIRNALIVFQFTISIFLIVGTLVIYQQVNFIRHKDLGFQKDQELVVEDVRAVGNKVGALKEEIKKINQVENITLSDYLPTPSARGGTTYFLEGAMGTEGFNSDKATIMEKWLIDYDYLPTLGLKIIAGRNFDPGFGTDSSALLLNESAVKLLGLTPGSALGMRMTSDFHRPDKENMKYLTVIGVVKNFHYESLRHNIDALSLALGSNANKMVIKLRAGDFQESIDGIKEKWDKLANGQPFHYYFMDDSFNDTYKSELRLGGVFITFTMLSLCIACLGLFGLATFNAEKKTKEIGIKKVMGASVGLITFQLSYYFLKLVALASMISLPLSWFAMSKWLEGFSFRVDISTWTLALAAVLAMIVSLATVGFQSVKTAMTNPVKSLRSE